MEWWQPQLAREYLLDRTNTWLALPNCDFGCFECTEQWNVHWTLPASHPLGGPDEHTYDFYISNAEGTSFAYGPFFTVAYPPFEITSPAANTHYSLGQNVTVQWNGGNPSSLVNIYLIERTPGLPFQTATSVASNVPNSGTFNWTLPASHPLGGPDEHTYDFYISNAEGTSFTYGPFFTVDYSPFEITSPVVDSRISLGDSVTVQWNGGNPANLVNIYLVERTPGLPFQLATAVASNISNTGTYQWTLPTTHPLGGPLEHTYDLYIENIQRTKFSYGPFFKVGYPAFDVALSDHSIDENAVDATTIGVLSASNPNVMNLLNFTLPSEVPDNAFFDLDSSHHLLAKHAFDFETRSTFEIVVRVTDAGSFIMNKTFTIHVNNLNDPPVLNTLPVQSFGAITEDTFASVNKPLRRLSQQYRMPILAQSRELRLRRLQVHRQETGNTHLAAVRTGSISVRSQLRRRC